MLWSYISCLLNSNSNNTNDSHRFDELSSEWLDWPRGFYVSIWICVQHLFIGQSGKWPDLRQTEGQIRKCKSPIHVINKLKLNKLIIPSAVFVTFNCQIIFFRNCHLAPNKFCTLCHLAPNKFFCLCCCSYCSYLRKIGSSEGGSDHRITFAHCHRIVPIKPVDHFCGSE